ncbi:TetR/AcrR family transcriptional regulator [Zhongshania sp.]|uniref:TetR/AcrR family transcriptional regulator n=1 Tax=Zhongshania sp. TaxID=1971902 RepID=UPI00356B4C7C
MATTRRRGKKDSKTRIRLIDEALILLSEDGISALSARNLAQRLDLSFQIVHYYFKSMDDLLIAVIDHCMTGLLTILEGAIDSDNPLETLIELHKGQAAAALSLEFEIYAGRRPALREPIKRYTDLFRQAEYEAVSCHLKKHNIDKNLPPLAVTVMLTSAFRVLAIENAIGVTMGHKETLAWLSSLLSFPITHPAELTTNPATTS